MSNRLTERVVLIREEGDAARSTPSAFGGGAVIGAFGGLIGLGGAEFRLPLLIGAFRFAALQAVILNKAMSLVVVASALPFRAWRFPWRALPLIGRSLSICSPAACWAHGLEQAGQRASRHTRSIASLPFCFLGSPLCWRLGTMQRRRGPC